MSDSKVTIRLSATEHNELKKRAKAANMSVNRYMITSSLDAAPREDSRLSGLMGELCKLELCVQRANDLETLKNDVRAWRRQAILVLGGNNVWPK